jgi:hypothetical protein
MEDKIVGPLTLKQFLFVMGGGMIIYVALNTAPTGLFFLIAVPVGLLSLALAFLKIQDQPFSKFIMSFVMYLFKPKDRAWQKNIETEKFASELTNFPKVKPKNDDTDDRDNLSELEKLAQSLDVENIEQIELEHKKNPLSAEQKEVIDMTKALSEKKDEKTNTEEKVEDKEKTDDIFQNNK